MGFGSGMYLERCSGIAEIVNNDMPLRSRSDHQRAGHIHGIEAFGESDG